MNTCPERLIGETPLHCALGGEQEETALFLIRRGADVNATALNGRQPLHYAAEAGLTVICKALLQKGANPSVRAKDGKNAADIAESAGETELAHFLRLRERDTELKVVRKQKQSEETANDETDISTEAKGVASATPAGKKNVPKSKRPAEKR